jgi:hypothetical protein
LVIAGPYTVCRGVSLRHTDDGGEIAWRVAVLQPSIQKSVQPSASLCWGMTFDGMTNDEVADVWYALAGAEIRHPGCFARILEDSHAELLRRLGNSLAPFVEERFRKLRAQDAPDDAIANVRATSDTSCD